MYATRASLTDTGLLRVTPVEDAFAPNKYSYHVECLLSPNDSQLQKQTSTTTVRFTVSHKTSLSNTCPIEFDYEVQVSCAQPHSVHLSQLLVNNEDSDGGSAALSKLKWNCPIKASAGHAIAHFRRPLFVEVKVRDVVGNVFDNFTSVGTKLEWSVANKKVVEKSAVGLDWLEMGFDEAGKGVWLSRSAEVADSQKVYFQAFETKGKFGEGKVGVRLSGLASELNVQFVEDVRVSPETLTVFNHPSNVVSLSLSNGSGYYHAEIETIRMALSEQRDQQEQVGGFE